MYFFFLSQSEGVEQWEDVQALRDGGSVRLLGQDILRPLQLAGCGRADMRSARDLRAGRTTHPTGQLPGRDTSLHFGVSADRL